MELDASEQERRQLAYSTQFFDFTPDAFIDGVSGASYEAINEHLDVSYSLFSYFTCFYIQYLTLKGGTLRSSETLGSTLTSFFASSFKLLILK